MRVGLVSAEFPPAIGGVGDHTARLAQELARAGHAVDVLTSATPSAAPTDGVRVWREVRRWDVRIWWQVPRVARRRDWDVLHIQYQPAAYALHGAINILPWAARHALPAVVTTFHDLRFPYLFPKAGPLRSAAVGALAKGSDAVIAVSDDDLPQLRHWRGGRPPETTRHIPLGDQLDAELHPNDSRHTWDAPLVAYFGLMNESKGVLDLVEAIASLDRVHLVMIGETLGAADPTNEAYLRAVQSRVASLGLERRVHWTGFASPREVGRWLEVADVVALPFTDGASLRRTSLIAAWRRGRPVVTTTPRVTAGWFADEREVAQFIPPRDPSALAGAIETLLTDAARRTRIAAAGARFAERFAWPAVVRETVSVYEAALRLRRA